MLLAATLVTFAIQGQSPAPPPAGSQRDVPADVRRDVLAPATAPLDPRVKPGAITQGTPPPLPERVVQPLPAVLRIATKPDEVPISKDHFEKALAAIDKGLAYLRNTQGPDGGWLEGTPAAGTDQPKPSSAATLAVTGLAIKAFAQRGVSMTVSPELNKAVNFVVGATHRDGKFQPDPGGGVGNYVATSVAMGLAAIGDLDHRDQLNETIAWIKQNQWDQSKGVSPDQDWFGGAGYGGGGRPDLSNTQMMLDALHDAGVSPDDPAVQRAILFVSRCQNLKETNSSAWAQAGSNDGGMIYSGANGGESIGSEIKGEGRRGEKIPEGTPRTLRSYGSMTYAGFKSLLYAGLSKDDIRVRSAFDWVRHHWTFDENPGIGADGHFYYLHAAARALSAAQQNKIEDAAGASHNWREELIDAIVKQQRPDGSYANTAERWLESKPELATVYLVLALEEALKPVLTSE